MPLSRACRRTAAQMLVGCQKKAKQQVLGSARMFCSLKQNANGVSVSVEKLVFNFVVLYFEMMLRCASFPTVRRQLPAGRGM